MSAVIYNSELFTIEASFDSVADAEIALPADAGNLVAALRSDYVREFTAMQERRDSVTKVDSPNESRMTDLERYQSYKRVLDRPIFDSIEEAEENMRAVEGKFRRFVVREPLGIYRVYFCFMSQSRGSDELKWACNEEYCFSHGQMNSCKNRAALAVGLELVESM